MLRCLDHCPSFWLTVGERRLRFTPDRPKCVAFYYSLDPDLCLTHVRRPTLPFPVRVGVDGHDCRPDRCAAPRLRFVQEGYGFTELRNPACAKRLADRLEREDWPRGLRSPARRVLPLLGDMLEHFNYHWVAVLRRPPAAGGRELGIAGAGRSPRRPAGHTMAAC